MSNIAINEEAQVFQVMAVLAENVEMPNGVNLAGLGDWTNLNWEQYRRIDPDRFTDGSIILVGQMTPISATRFLVQIPITTNQFGEEDIRIFYPPVHPDTPGLDTFTINSWAVWEATTVAGVGGTIDLTLEIDGVAVTGASITVAVATRAPGVWADNAAITAANTGVPGSDPITVVGANESTEMDDGGRVLVQMLITYS